MFLRGIERVSDSGLLYRLCACYYAQMGVGYALFYGMFASTGYWPAFATATMHPFSRLPVFLMGVYAAVLCSRYPITSAPHAADAGSRSSGTSSSPAGATAVTAWEAGSPSTAVMPWLPTYLGVLPVPVRPCRPLVSAGDWGGMASWYSCGLLLCTLALGAADTALGLATGAGGGVLLGAVWLQLLVPWAQLNVIVGVTRDGGSSLASRALLSPLAQWLGRVSMAVYLLHVPLIHYLAWAVNGALNPHPASMTCADGDKACSDDVRRFVGAQLMPVWGIAVVPFAALGLGALCYHAVEEPARKWLRAKE